MGFVDAHAAVSRRFDRWIRVMEIRTRLLEREDATLGEAKAMIISPPTDTGIRMIAKANERGTTYLLCWSTRIFEEASRDAKLHRLSLWGQALPSDLPIFWFPGTSATRII